MRSTGRNPALTDILLACVMTVFVATPLAGALRSGSSPVASSVEQRRLGGLPQWPKTLQAWTQFPRAFDVYARDRFGYREDLLSGYRWLLSSVFHESASARVFVGRYDWLYEAGEGAIEDIQGASPYTDASISNDVEQINARGELLAVRHVRYGFVVFPDKHTVYPQFLPVGVYGGFAKRRLNALDAAMSMTGHDYYFDATDALRKYAKESSFPLYYKTDTHWNPWGAWLGYSAWQGAQGARLGLPSFEYQFRQFTKPRQSPLGDLARMSGYHPDDFDVFPPAGAGCEASVRRNATTAIVHDAGVPPDHLFVSHCGGTGDALVFHDSFMASISGYVAAGYARHWSVWAFPDDPAFADMVHALRPDTVIVQRVERLMRQFPPVNLDALVRGLGIVGEQAEINERGDLILGSRKYDKTHSSERAAGSLERIARNGEQMSVEGWARMGESSPATVIAVASGKIIGEAPVTLHRRDVAATTRNPKLAWSGFRMNFPAVAVPERCEELHWYFVDFATYGELPMHAQNCKRLEVLSMLGKGQLGARATVIDGKLLIAGHEGSFTHANEFVGGSLDKIVRQGSQVHFEGWGRMGESNPVAVIAVAGNQIVGEAPVAMRRVDVAVALKNPGLTLSGFKMDIPLDSVEPDGGKLHLYFIDANRYGEFPFSARDKKLLQTVTR